MFPTDIQLRKILAYVWPWGCHPFLIVTLTLVAFATSGEPRALQTVFGGAVMSCILFNVMQLHPECPLD